MRMNVLLLQQFPFAGLYRKYWTRGIFLWQNSERCCLLAPVSLMWLTRFLCFMPLWFKYVCVLEPWSDCDCRFNFIDTLADSSLSMTLIKRIMFSTVATVALGDSWHEYIWKPRLTAALLFLFKCYFQWDKSKRDSNFDSLRELT